MQKLMMSSGALALLAILALALVLFAGLRRLVAGRHGAVA